MEIKNNHKILSVHYMRGIACIFVVLMHYGSFVNNAFFFGIFGVDLFFIISGFIITLTTEKKDSIKGFLAKRFFRIYPSFFVVWLITIPALFLNEPLYQIVKSMLLIHKEYDWHSAPGYGWNLIGPPWTLTYEFLFYSIMWFAMLVSHKHRVVITSAFIFISVFMLQLAYNGQFSFDSYVSAKINTESPFQIPAKLLSTTILLEFVFGMIIAKLYKYIKLLSLKKSIYFSMLCLAVSLSLFVRKPDVGFGFYGFFWHSSSLFIGILLLEPFLRTFKSSILNFMGDISFSLYLVHFPMMKICLLYIPFFNDGEHKVFTFICIMILSFVFSWILHRKVEIPIMNKTSFIIRNKTVRG